MASVVILECTHLSSRSKKKPFCSMAVSCRTARLVTDSQQHCRCLARRRSFLPASITRGGWPLASALGNSVLPSRLQVSGEKEFFADMVVEAVSKLDHATLDLKLIGTKKVQGGGLRDSFLVDGVAFKKTFSYAGFEMQPKQYKDPNILLLNIELELKSEKENAEVGSHYTLVSGLACAQAIWQGSATHRLGAQVLLRGMSNAAALSTEDCNHGVCREGFAGGSCWLSNCLH